MGDKNHPQMVGLLLGLPREMCIYIYTHTCLYSPMMDVSSHFLVKAKSDNTNSLDVEGSFPNRGARTEPS